MASFSDCVYMYIEWSGNEINRVGSGGRLASQPLDLELPNGVAWLHEVSLVLCAIKIQVQG